MSNASRRERQRRAPLARYLPAALMATMFDLNPGDISAWATGDTRVISVPNRSGTVFDCFTYAARVLGLENAHHWFTAPNAGLRGFSPAEAIVAKTAVQAVDAARTDTPFAAIPLAALDLRGRPRVALAGDWHGNLGHALGSIQRLGRLGIRTVFHLGDFSLWPGPHGAKYIRRITQACEQYDITIYVTDGNHEDHDRLALIEPVDGIRWITDRIGYFERGTRWEWARTTFLSLGGAPSVNRANLTEGRSWWRGEQISHKEAATAINKGAVDVMLSHDAPEPATRAVERIIRHNPQRWPPDALRYAAEGRARLTYAFQTVQPSLLAHGHHHVVDRAIVSIPGATHDTEIISLGCDGKGGNLAILDIETLKVVVI